MKKLITPIIYLLIGCVVGYQANELKRSPQASEPSTVTEQVIVTALMQHRINDMLVLSSAYKRGDEEDVLKFIEGTLATELVQYGDDRYAYSKERTEYFERNHVVARLKDYIDKNPESSLRSLVEKLDANK